MFQSKEDKNHNPRRHVKQARQPMIIGIRPLIEAMLAGKEIDKVLVQQGLKGDLYAELKELLGEHMVPQQIVPVEKLNRITRSNHQGIIAFVSPISYGNLENMIAQVFEDGETPLFLLLDGITDVRNLGSICRSAECLGAQAIIVPEKGSAQINEEAIKTFNDLFILDQTLFVTFFEIGKIHLENKEYESALHYFDKYIAENPSSHEAFYCKALAERKDAIDYNGSVQLLSVEKENHSTFRAKFIAE
jgi:tetratricopeptide (TPR) repeat protein